MAKLKKNAIGNIIFPMVDKTDFASLESGITASDFNSAATKKFYGVNHGVSNAYTSGALSMATLLVRSGIFHQELKATETNYDHVMYRFIHASCADQLIVFETATYDDSDAMSRLSDIGSNLISMVSDLFSNVSDIQSQVDLNASLLASVATSDFLSDVESNLYSAIGNVSVTLSASDISDIVSAIIAGGAGDSNVVSMLSDMFSDLSDIGSQVDLNASMLAGLSDFQSNLLSRVPKLVATNSQVSDLVSDLRSYLVGMSGMLSDVDSQLIVNFSLISDVDSQITLNTATLSALVSQVSDVESQVDLLTTSDYSSKLHSDIYSAIGNVSVTLTSSDISDIASAVAAAVDDSNVVSMLSDMFSNISDIESQVDLNASLLANITGQASVLLSNLSDVDSQLTVTDATLSDFQSNLLSRVPKLVATNSQVSDLASDLRSYLVGISGMISDVDSQMTLDTATLSVLASLVSDIDSQVNLGATSNYLSQVHSDLASAIGGVTASVGASDMSDIASRVWATSEGTRVDSRILVLQSNLSDVESAVDLLATSAYLSDVESNLYSAIGNVSVTLTDSDISDIASAVAAAGGSVSASDMSDIASRVWANSTRTLTQGAASVEAAVSGSTITVYRGTTWVISLTGLGDISTYDTIFFSVKENVADSDDDAILRVKDDASGLLRWNKAEVGTATNGVITIDDAAAGNITITILEAETANATIQKGYYYDVKGVDDDGQVDLLSIGLNAFTVSGDITRAITS